VRWSGEFSLITCVSHDILEEEKNTCVSHDILEEEKVGSRYIINKLFVYFAPLRPTKRKKHTHFFFVKNKCIFVLKVIMLNFVINQILVLYNLGKKKKFCLPTCRPLLKKILFCPNFILPHYDLPKEKNILTFFLSKTNVFLFISEHFQVPSC
jgi:hypothetical protein